MLIHKKDDIEFVTEFPCFLGHPVVQPCQSWAYFMFFFSTTLPDFGILYVLISVHFYQIRAYFMFLFQYNPARFRFSPCYFLITVLPGFCLLHVLVLVAGLLQKLAKETECPICLLEMKERVFQCVSGRIIPVQGFNRTSAIDINSHI